MWLSRQLQLYLAAICLGLARHLGKSTYASAITHGLVFAIALFGLDSLDTPTRFRRLGVAAVELKVGDQALVIDLFFTRPPLRWLWCEQDESNQTLIPVPVPITPDKLSMAAHTLSSVGTVTLGFPVTIFQRLADLLAYSLAWWYSVPGVWFFLPLRANRALPGSTARVPRAACFVPGSPCHCPARLPDRSLGTAY